MSTSNSYIIILVGVVIAAAIISTIFFSSISDNQMNLDESITSKKIPFDVEKCAFDGAKVEISKTDGFTHDSVSDLYDAENNEKNKVPAQLVLSANSSGQITITHDVNPNSDSNPCKITLDDAFLYKFGKDMIQDKYGSTDIYLVNNTTEQFDFIISENNGDDSPLHVSLLNHMNMTDSKIQLTYEIKSNYKSYDHDNEEESQIFLISFPFGCLGIIVNVGEYPIDEITPWKSGGPRSCAR